MIFNSGHDQVRKSDRGLKKIDNRTMEIQRHEKIVRRDIKKRPRMFDPSKYYSVLSYFEVMGASAFIMLWPYGV